MDFLDRFFSRDMKEVKVEDFLNLRQCSILVKEYCLKFTLQAKYTLELLPNSRAHMSKFVTWVSELVVKDCITITLIGDTDIAQLMMHAQQSEVEKLEKYESKE